MSGVTFSIAEKVPQCLELYLDLEQTEQEGLVLIQDVFFKDADEPVFTHHTKMEDILKQYIETHSIPDGSLRVEHKEEIVGVLQSMQEELNRAIAAVEAMPIR